MSGRLLQSQFISLNTFQQTENYTKDKSGHRTTKTNKHPLGSKCSYSVFPIPIPFGLRKCESKTQFSTQNIDFCILLSANVKLGPCNVVNCGSGEVCLTSFQGHAPLRPFS